MMPVTWRWKILDCCRRMMLAMWLQKNLRSRDWNHRLPETNLRRIPAGSTVQLVEATLVSVHTRR
jgi:hypothetical protein